MLRESESVREAVKNDIDDILAKFRPVLTKMQEEVQS